MSREMFIEQFVAAMLRSTGPTFDDGEPVEAYARETAPSYWDDEGQRADGPDECARADMSYWGEWE